MGSPVSAILCVKPLVRVNLERKRTSLTDKFYDLHKSYGHLTVDCKVVQAQIKVKSQWDTMKPYKTQKNSETRSSTFSKDHNKKEIMSMVKETVKEIFQNSKKRKIENHATEEQVDDFDVKEFVELHLSEDEEKE